MNPRVNVTENLISSLVVTGALILPLLYIPVGIFDFVNDTTAEYGFDAFYPLQAVLL